MNLAHFEDINKNMTVRIENLDTKPIVIFDDFYTHPESIRNTALSLGYGLSVRQGKYKRYPGQRAFISFWQENVISHLIKIYSELELNFQHLLSRVQKQPLTFTIMNDSLKDIHPEQRVPHIDNDTSLIGVVYLTPSNFCEGGTAFYRHRESGISYLPPIPSLEIGNLMQEKGFDPFKKKDYVNYIKFLMYSGIEEVAEETKGSTGLGKSNATWELLCFIPMKFNRLILFPGNCFHSPFYEFNEI